MQPRRFRPILALLLVLCAALLSLALAQLPQTNSAGIRLLRQSAALGSSAEQINGAGAVVRLTAAFDSSADRTNAAGVTANLGHIEFERQRNAAGVVWLDAADANAP